MENTRYQAIADSIATAIQRGELTPGTQLPTVRALMDQHGIALATAARVYRTLEVSGLVVGERGRGTFVRDTSLAGSDGLLQLAGTGKLVDLGFNYPALPGQDEILRDGLRTLALSGDLDALLQSAPQGGRVHQRDTAARYLRNRGIRVEGNQVLIVNGAQHGLSITLTALFEPGDVLAVDALTYPGMLAAARAQRIELVALPETNGCTDLDALDVLCQYRSLRALYCMPTMHNPLGSVLGVAARKRIATLARHHDFLIIEDGAYAFLAEPAPKPLQVFAPERTIYVTGLSKSFASGLRIGFVAAPVPMVAALEQAIRVSAWGTPSITVALACHWIASGVIDTLEDAKRRDARLRQRLARRVLQYGTIVAHPSSYFLWLQLAQGVHADVLALKLREAGVLVTTAEPFSAAPPVPQALRLSLGSVTMEVLQHALSRVNELIFSAAP